MREIADVARHARHPERLNHLLGLIEDEQGYALYQAVSAAKTALSHEDTARLVFRHRDLVIDRQVTRTEFESWIRRDLARFGAAMDRVMAQARLQDHQVDHVVLTGGTSFVPAVRRLFVDRFGADRLATGDEFVSVAEGLALIGRDRVWDGSGYAMS
jgi:hypothetical chaperone protein